MPRRTATVDRKRHSDYGENNQQFKFLKRKFSVTMSFYMKDICLFEDKGKFIKQYVLNYMC